MDDILKTINKRINRLEEKVNAIGEELDLLRSVEIAARAVVSGLQTVETEYEESLIDAMEKALEALDNYRSRPDIVEITREATERRLESSDDEQDRVFSEHAWPEIEDTGGN